MNLMLTVILLRILVSVCDSRFPATLFRLIMPGGRLDNGPMKIIPDLSLVRCAMTSKQNPSYVAFNYNADNETCELISQPSFGTTNLITDRNYNYYSGLQPCEPNPCPYNASCKVTPEELDYDCFNCPFPLVSRRCENYYCGGFPGCCLTKGSLYFSNLNTPVSWLEAYHSCSSKNLSFRSEDIKYQDISVSPCKEKLLFTAAVDKIWIALNRTDAASEWKWVDGTPLTETDSKWDESDDQTNGNCATLDFLKNTWQTKNCDEIAYFFCQKLYP